MRICSFADWLEAAEILLDRAVERGAVAFKCALAYQRPLRFARVVPGEAEAGFNEMFKVKHFPDWEKKSFIVGEAFQDYMMHFLLRLVNKRHMAIQFHTGIQEGNGNIVQHSDPSLLANLFLEYPEVNFDLFHIGYPYQQVMSVLAKTFPNVYLDMCWAHIVSPTASVNALAEWIDSVPLNKISAFGGDFDFIDGVYGHQYLARLNVARSLATKIGEGVIDLRKRARSRR